MDMLFFILVVNTELFDVCSYINCLWLVFVLLALFLLEMTVICVVIMLSGHGIFFTPTLVFRHTAVIESV